MAGRHGERKGCSKGGSRNARGGGAFFHSSRNYISGQRGKENRNRLATYLTGWTTPSARRRVCCHPIYPGGQSTPFTI